MSQYRNIVLLLLVFFIGCNGKKAQYKSPAGYDLNKPEQFWLGSSLTEISGITFIEGKKDTIYAIEDESGKLFSIAWGNENSGYSKFAKKGDFEDVTILNEKTVAVLKSDGSILLFPVSEIGKEKIDSVQEDEKILPEGEYEGLSVNNGKLIALCKNCMSDNEKKEVSVSTLELDAAGVLKPGSSVKIDLTPIQTEGKKEKFHPSCIAKNPVTQDWFIVSSVNKLLLVLDEQWKVKESYPLDPSVFKQPEGMTFNARGDLYISNEGAGGAANILLFRYKKM